MWKIFSFFCFNYHISKITCCRNAQVTFVEKPAIEDNNFSLVRQSFLGYHCKSGIVDFAWGSLVITLTVPSNSDFLILAFLKSITVEIPNYEFCNIDFFLFLSLISSLFYLMLIADMSFF